MTDRDAARAVPTPCRDPYLPRSAVVRERVTELPNVVTLRLELEDAGPGSHDFVPGQFNMLHGADGDVPISIVAGNERGYFEHCIRAVGNASRELAAARKGDYLGLRGPFGGGCWPLTAAAGKDVIVVSGGIGCAAVASAIEHIAAARDRYGRLAIMQGVSKDADHLYGDRYRRWAELADTQVLLASMEGGPGWEGRKGLVTELFDELETIRIEQTVAMVCGPEVMVRPTVARLLDLGLAADLIYVSLERNMQCGIAHCGHCQIGGCLVCRDGPVFPFSVSEQALSHGP
ncbi:MAG: FAD/NAD(P)-binding protein [Deltaproteobacteria bacterium]|nr:FAD/NAD(P)-binding protein [Deltaproteobacteria bacterium]